MRRPPAIRLRLDPSIETTRIRGVVQGRRRNPMRARDTAVRREAEQRTMDTSRGPDGPIYTRSDQHLRRLQGLHIMIRRQTW